MDTSTTTTTTTLLPPCRLPTPPPAYTPPHRCYHTRANSTKPSTYVPRGHPRAVQAHPSADEKILFYKPKGYGDDDKPAPPYEEEDEAEDEADGGVREDCWSARDAAKLAARIRALEAQLAAAMRGEGKGK